MTAQPVGQPGCWRVVDRFGIDQLVQEEAAAPEPPAGAVRLRMSAWSLNHRDLLMVEGAYEPRLPLPFVPLSDGVGRVEAVGAGVSLQIGDRVLPIFAPGWHDGAPGPDQVRNTRGGRIPGLLADQVIVPAADVVKAPDCLTDVEAATLPCAGLTAWSALALANVRPGQKVLVLGTGGVSLFALQLARLRGAVVAAVTSSKAKATVLEQLGAAHIVDYTENPAWGRTMRKWSGDGVDLVIEVGGAGTLEQSLAATAVGGTVAIIGQLTGAREPLNLLPIFMRQIRCQGVFVGHRRGLSELVQAVQAHELRPIIDTVYRYDEAPNAFRAMAAKQHVGKLALAR